MASDLRKRWQDFKKAHPDFEKSKSFKSDVGPQLDKFDQARDQYAALKAAALEKLQQKAQEVVKLGTSAGAALKGYEAVVKELEGTDKTIRRDFNASHFEVFTDAYVRQYAKKITIDD